MILMFMHNHPNYVAIIDYEMSNIFSVKAACDKVGIESVITNNIDEILNAKALILPGVGAFGEAMIRINRLKLDYAIKKFIDKGNFFLGICLGMQLLYEFSDEFGLNKGLGIIKGGIKKFNLSSNQDSKFPVPHTGWNKIIFNKNIEKKNSLFENLKDNTFMYFVHSHYVDYTNNTGCFGKTKYGNISFCSVFNSENIVAVQFHPEKSGKNGLAIYKKLKKKISIV